MNTLDFKQTGGFPMDTDVLDQMQNAWSLLNSLGELAGNFAIIKGCESIGLTIGNGVVYIDGEVLEFIGGIQSDTVIIVQEVEKKEFENGSSNPVHYHRYATFGAATTSYFWSNFKRIFPTTEIQLALDLKEDKTVMSDLLIRLDSLEKKNAVFCPGGGMVLWNKAFHLIPPGWKEVVDWRGRMPMGYNPDQYEFSVVGGSGGAQTKTLSELEMPAHSHGMFFDEQKVGTGNPNGIGDFASKKISMRTEITGKGNSFSIMNPYRVVLFIEYID